MTQNPSPTRPQPARGPARGGAIEAAGLDSSDPAHWGRAISAGNHHRGTWLSEQEGVIHALQEELRHTYAPLTSQLAQLDRERRVLAGLREFPDGGVLTQVDFGRPQPGAERITQLRNEAVAAEVASHRGNMRDLVPRDQAHLLAELKRQIEEA